MYLGHRASGESGDSWNRVLGLHGLCEGQWPAEVSHVHPGRPWGCPDRWGGWTLCSTLGPRGSSVTLPAGEASQRGGGLCQRQDHGHTHYGQPPTGTCKHGQHGPLTNAWSRTNSTSERLSWLAHSRGTMWLFPGPRTALGSPPASARRVKGWWGPMASGGAGTST